MPQIKIETQLVVHDERKISPFVNDDNISVPKTMLVERNPQIVADQSQLRKRFGSHG